MKKKTILLLTALISYCYLFFEQSPGVNFLLFDIILLISMLIMDKSLLKNRPWLMIASGSLIAAFGIVLYGNFLSVFAHVFSLLLLTHLNMKRGSSLVFTFLQAGYNYLSMPYFAATKIFLPPLEITAKPNRINLGNVLKIALPLLVVLIFILVYRSANPVFNEMVNSINLDFISWEFIWFTLLGLFLLTGFYYPKACSTLLKTDKRAQDVLPGELNENEFSIFSDIRKEYSAATLSFALLNGLLFLINFLDLDFILGGGRLPDGMNHSQYVHQGVNSSICSILMAILVTLYFFRGNLNYITKNKALRILALIWIAQNVILIGTCIYKNWIYIHDCGLTYKRIGVYIYLLLIFVGLCTTWIKITALKSNWYLLRRNAWSIYTVLIISTLFHWDRIIINYNATHASGVEKAYYLDTMSESALPILLTDLETEQSGMHYDRNYRYRLEYKVYQFLRNYRNKGWQSWNLEDERIYNLIKNKKVL